MANKQYYPSRLSLTKFLWNVTHILKSLGSLSREFVGGYQKTKRSSGNLFQLYQESNLHFLVHSTSSQGGKARFQGCILLWYSSCTPAVLLLCSSGTPAVLPVLLLYSACTSLHTLEYWSRAFPPLLWVYRRKQGQNENIFGKTFVTPCKIRRESLRNHYGFFSESEKFFPKIFSFCPWFLRYTRSRVYQERKLAFLTQLEQIPSGFASLLITPEGLPEDFKMCVTFHRDFVRESRLGYFLCYVAVFHSIYNSYQRKKSSLSIFVLTVNFWLLETRLCLLMRINRFSFGCRGKEIFWIQHSTPIESLSSVSMTFKIMRCFLFDDHAKLTRKKNSFVSHSNWSTVVFQITQTGSLLSCAMMKNKFVRAKSSIFNSWSVEHFWTLKLKSFREISSTRSFGPGEGQGKALMSSSSAWSWSADSLVYQKLKTQSMSKNLTKSSFILNWQISICVFFWVYEN